MPKSEQNPKELERHSKAFEAYYAQGEKRSFSRLAKELGVSVASLKVWSKSFRWQQRIRERDATVARQAADQVIGSAVAHASRNRKMVELALMKVIKAINSDKVKVQVGDLDRLLRLQAFLDGDGAIITAETLRRRPMMEVCDAYDEWIKSLSEEDLHKIIDERKDPVEGKPAATPPAPECPPTQGEVNDQAPNPAG